MKIKILQWRRFGRLTVVQQAPSIGTDTHAHWNCLCDCGKTITVRGGHLTSGRVVSCGCFHDSKVTTHSKTRSSEYWAYHNMLRRCYNPNEKSYPDYGGRGITVCDRWLESFENFYADMGNKPFADYSIDRIDNNDGYSSENCRWADKVTQQNNTRRNKRHGTL